MCSRSEVASGVSDSNVPRDSRVDPAAPSPLAATATDRREAVGPLSNSHATSSELIEGLKIGADEIEKFNNE